MNIYHIAPKRSGHVFVGNMIKSWCPNATYLDLENMSPMAFIKRFSPFKEDKIVIQTRDLLNWSASYLQAVSAPNKKPPLSYAQITTEFFQCRLLPDAIRIYYDDFFEDELYRRKICDLLGGNYNTTELNKVYKNGGGSSFDGRRFDGSAQTMNVLQRWEQVDQQKLRSFIMLDDRLRKLYKQYYNDGRL